MRLLDGAKLVAEHPRCWLRKTRIEIPDHRKALLAHKRAASQNKGRDRLHAEVKRVDELLQLWANDGRFMGTRVVRTCKLLDIYGSRIVTSAVAELLNRGSHDYGALAILCEKRRVKPHVALPMQLADHVQDRDVIPHDLGGYDD